MYASRVTPVQRMRTKNGGRQRQSSSRGISPSPKRRSLNLGGRATSVIGIKSPRMNGDYQVLKLQVEKERKTVQQARVAFASSLDQLGEHHVRQQEYDDAMDAFTEALREKRSVFWQISTPNNNSNANDHSNRSRGSSFSSSLLSGEVGGEEMVHDKAVDEIVNTLRNMGNVHSLRGEQDEAMRYYTEVTSLRAQKQSANASCLSSDPASTSGAEASNHNKSMLSGLNDDTSTLMSEINEDVKALDDLFRSISFRHQSNNGNANNSNSNSNNNHKSSHSHSHSNSSNGSRGTDKSVNEKRKSKTNCPTTHSNHNYPASGNKRRKSEDQANSSGNSSGSNVVVENEPFKRSTSSLCLPASGNEVSEAMDMYRSVLDSYSYDMGHSGRLDPHKEILNSLALRADLLNENRRKAASIMTVDPIYNSSSESGGPTNTSNSTSPRHPSLSKAADLELALEVYHQILLAHEDNKQARHSQQQQHPQSQESQIEKEQLAASHVASTLICMGSVYYKLGNRVEELDMYRQAKVVYQRAFGESHTFVAGTRKNIGMVLAERGEYERAMDQFEKAMQIYLAVNNTNSTQEDGSSNGGEVMSRDVASAISCMGNVKNRVGELDAALQQYMEALRIYKAIHQQQGRPSAEDDQDSSTYNNNPTASNNSHIREADALRDVTSTLKVIGMVHAKKGDLDTAMGFFQEAMTLLRSPGMDGTSPGRETTASVLTRIASIHLKKGDLDQAMAHYREAYDLTVRNRGTTNHQEVAGILHYIGGIYHKRADYDEAMACYQEGIRIYHSTLGPGNPTVAGTLVMVGSIYYKRRNLDSAMMFYREALRLNRDAYGMHHPDVAPILKSIGTILTKKGEYNEAYDIFRDVLSIKCTVHGTDHPEVASAYKSLGNVHYKLGELGDAERQYRHALSIYRKTKGEDHADTISAKTTIEHLRYWMREREQRQMEQRHTSNTTRGGGGGSGSRHHSSSASSQQQGESDERSC